MTVALHPRISRFFGRLKCRARGHEWIVNNTFTPPLKFTDRATQVKAAVFCGVACLMGLPEFSILAIGVTDVERLCADCGRYEKGILFGEATAKEASEKPLRGTTR